MVPVVCVCGGGDAELISSSNLDNGLVCDHMMTRATALQGGRNLDMARNDATLVLVLLRVLALSLVQLVQRWVHVVGLSEREYK